MATVWLELTVRVRKGSILRDAEADLIRQVLSNSILTRIECAAYLGISERNFYRLLREMERSDEAQPRLGKKGRRQ